MANERENLVEQAAQRYVENVAWNTAINSLIKSAPFLWQALKTGGAVATSVTPTGLAMKAIPILGGALLTELAPSLAGATAQKTSEWLGAGEDQAETIGDIVDLVTGLATGGVGKFARGTIEITPGKISDETLKQLLKQNTKKRMVRNLFRIALDPREAKRALRSKEGFEIGIRQFAKQFGQIANIDPDLVIDAIKKSETAQDLQKNILKLLRVTSEENIDKLSRQELVRLFQPMMQSGAKPVELRETFDQIRKNAISVLTEKGIPVTEISEPLKHKMQQFSPPVLSSKEFKAMRVNLPRVSRFAESAQKKIEQILEGQLKTDPNPQFTDILQRLKEFYTEMEVAFQDFAKFANIKPNKLPLGEKQKFQLAKKFAEDPELLVRKYNPATVLDILKGYVSNLYESLDEVGSPQKAELVNEIIGLLSETATKLANSIPQMIKPAGETVSGELMQDFDKNIKALKNFGKLVADYGNYHRLAKSFGLNFRDFKNFLEGNASPETAFKILNSFKRARDIVGSRLEDLFPQIKEFSPQDYESFVRRLANAYVGRLKTFAESEAGLGEMTDFTNSLERLMSLGETIFKEPTVTSNLSEIRDQIKILNAIKSPKFWEDIAKGGATGSQTAFLLDKIPAKTRFGSMLTDIIKSLTTDEMLNPEQARIVAQQLAQDLVAARLGQEAITPDLLNKAFQDALERAQVQKELADQLLRSKITDFLVEQYSDIFGTPSTLSIDDLDPNQIEGDEWLNEIEEKINSEDNRFGLKRKIRTKQGAEMEVEDLLARVAEAESGFNQFAISPKGALGLFQFMPATAERFGINPFNPQQAYEGAKQYLSQMLDEFGDIRLALAGYNWGDNRIRKLLQRGLSAEQILAMLPPETQNYLNKILGVDTTVGLV